MSYPSFARTRRFARRTIGIAWRVYLTSILSVVLWGAVLWLLPLLAELLATQGTLMMPADEAPELAGFDVQPSTKLDGMVVFERRGLLPAVWRLRQSPLGPVLSSLYGSCPPLRSSGSCLAVLIASIAAMTLLAGYASFSARVAIARAAIRTVGALRRQIRDQAHRLGAFDFFVQPAFRVTRLFAEEGDVLELGLMAWWQLVPRAMLMMLLVLATALAVDLWLTAAAGLLVAVGYRLYVAARRRNRRREQLAIDRAEGFAGILHDDLLQNRRLAGLAARPDAGSFQDDLRHFENAILARETSAAYAMPLRILFVTLCAATVGFLAGYNIVSQPPRLALADVVLLVSAVAAGAYPLLKWRDLQAQLPRADEAAMALFAYLDREPRVGQNAGAKPLERPRSQVTLDHATLSDASGKRLLDDVSLAVPIGSRTVLFGSDDATPLAIAGLVARLCDPHSGAILVDGQPLRGFSVDSVARQTSILIPEHLLVSGTIRENLVPPDQRVTQAELTDILKAAHAYEFISSLPEGLETVIGPRGLTLSAGEAIQIGLARTLLRDPAIVIIAEPKDSLDQSTAEQVAEALDRVAEGRTLIILARRLATLRLAPRILLFHEGRLLADGTHAELLQGSDLYRHLNYVRFNEFRDKLRTS